MYPPIIALIRNCPNPITGLTRQFHKSTSRKTLKPAAEIEHLDAATVGAATFGLSQPLSRVSLYAQTRNSQTHSCLILIGVYWTGSNRMPLQKSNKDNPSSAYSTPGISPDNSGEMETGISEDAPVRPKLGSKFEPKAKR